MAGRVENGLAAGLASTVLKQLGERYGIARADHHRILRAAFTEHEGQEIDTQGDAFFVAFWRARDPQWGTLFDQLWVR